jgi:Rieske Fe-S protein
MAVQADSTSGESDDGRAPVDARVDTPGREGLTGTAVAGLYAAIREADSVTLAPDGRPMAMQPAWRQDFPIDWPQDHYVERREFLKFLVLTSLAFTTGQIWIAAHRWWRPPQAAAPAARIASLAELRVGGAATFTYPGPNDACFVVRTGEDTFAAFGQKCTHLSCAVRPLPDRGVIHCPCHEGYFDLQTGRPIAGPPQRPLPLVRVEARGGELYATGVEERTV